MTSLEILVGVLVGLVFHDNRVVAAVATIGVLVLLFEVGLGMDRAELRTVGRRAIGVAVVGVSASFCGGALVMAAFGYEPRVVFFMAAALTATSVGVAARVFRHPTVLGAAVVDDVIGLVVLTITLRAIGDTASVAASLWRLNLVAAFVVGVAAAQTRWGSMITRPVQRVAHVLVPVFFFRVGLQLELDEVTRRAIAVGACLFVVAAAAKLLAGRVAERDHFLVGLGMLPRGEVTLVFAAAGLSAGVLTPSLYASLVLVVLATTLAASLAFRRLKGS